MLSVQIFGTKKSQGTRAAERFFKERRMAVHMVDLTVKPMSRGEIGRFVERFGLAALLDTEGKPYVDGGFAYRKMSDTEMLARIEREPGLLRLPLVRCGNRISAGRDEESWREMAAG